MTTKTGKGRGGARPGAGRPRKHPIKPPKEAAKPASKADQSASEPEISQNSAPEAPPSFDLTAEARKSAKKAVKRLEKIAEHGTEAGAVKAAALLFTWGFGSPALAKARAASETYRPEPAPEKKESKPPELGKKEIRRENAERATADGTFAVPSAPRLVADNTKG